MLVAAGPPPEGAVPETPRVATPAAGVHPRRRRWAEVALAAALVCGALAIGFVAGSRGDDFDPAVTLSMHSVSPAAGAAGELAIGERDPDGNVLIEMRVDGLPPLPASGWYELALANNGEVGAVCGTFVTSGEETSVRFTVGYDLKGLRKAGRYDAWVVTARVPGRPDSGQRVLLTT